MNSATFHKVKPQNRPHPFEEMLVVEYDTQFTQFRLPPLTLQPLAENAVKHGMNPDSGPLHVMIRTCRTDKAGVIVVEAKRSRI